MNVGWIKLHRQILNWEWYSDTNTFRLFLHLLLTANFKDQKYQGKLIKKGSLLTGRDKLSYETGLSVREVRTCLERLKSTNEIAIKSNSKGTEIQVVNYDKYQVETNETTNERPTSDQQTTTIKERKEKEEVKEVYSFDEFWSTYGRSIGKKNCKAKFEKLSDEVKLKIKEVLPLYVQSTPQVIYRKHPLTWLNQECWNDEIEIRFEGVSVSDIVSKPNATIEDYKNMYL
jgi:hypothetical protein